MVVLEAGAPADAVNVTVAEQVGLQLAGVNALAVTPVGSGVVMLKVTGVVVPDTSVAVAVSIPPGPPALIVRVAGVAARLKLKPPVTVMVGEYPFSWIWLGAVEPVSFGTTFTTYGPGVE